MRKETDRTIRHRPEWRPSECSSEFRIDERQKNWRKPDHSTSGRKLFRSVESWSIGKLKSAQIPVADVRSVVSGLGHANRNFLPVNESPDGQFVASIGEAMRGEDSPMFRLVSCPLESSDNRSSRQAEHRSINCESRKESSDDPAFHFRSFAKWS